MYIFVPGVYLDIDSYYLDPHSRHRARYISKYVARWNLLFSAYKHFEWDRAGESMKIFIRVNSIERSTENSIVLNQVFSVLCDTVMTKSKIK